MSSCLLSDPSSNTLERKQEENYEGTLCFMLIWIPEKTKGSGKKSLKIDTEAGGIVAVLTLVKN